MTRRRILVTGGSGFLGSHLCERLLNDGHEVVCLDNFFTGSRANVEHLLDNHRFELMRHDVTEKLTMEVDEVYHLACPASPIHYQRNPVRTIRTAVEGTLNMLDLAREAKARILIASTSEVYGDPTEHPQRESYWGNVNPIGPRACYDEGKRCAESLAVSYAQPVRRRGAHRPHLQHLRPAHARERRARRLELRRAGAAQRADHRLRRGAADALVLLRDRSDRGLRAPDGQPPRRRSGQPGQPARDDRAGAGRDHQAARQVASRRSSARRCPRTTRPAASPTSPARSSCSAAGAPASPSKRGIAATIDDFKARLGL